MARTRKIIAGVALSTSLVALTAGTASAGDNTTITATLAQSLTVDVDTAALSPTLSVGNSTFDGGDLTVTGNVVATASASFDKTAMTKWESGAYVNGTTLGSPLAVVATPKTIGTGVPGGATSATGGAVATSALGTNVFDLSYTQPVSITDAPGTYRIVVTYSVAAGV